MQVAEQGIQVSKERINDILVSNLANQNVQLQQEIARLTAVNEALIGRLNEHSNREQAEANGHDGNNYAPAPTPPTT